MTKLNVSLYAALLLVAASATLFPMNTSLADAGLICKNSVRIG